MKFKTIFLIGDGEVDRANERFGADSIECPETLPLTWDFNHGVDKVIGEVKVTRLDSLFQGEFEVNEEAAKRAWDLPNISDETFKTLLGFVYPAVEGWSKETKRVDGGVREITKCTINAVTLTMSPNCDSRIKRLREVL